MLVTEQRLLYKYDKNLKAIITEAKDIGTRRINHVGCLVDSWSNLQIPKRFTIIVSTIVSLSEEGWISCIVVDQIVVRSTRGTLFIGSHKSGSDQIGGRNSVAKDDGGRTI